VTEIQGATQRAIALTRQLLAFSRQQPVDPRVLDVNAVVTGLLPMLERLVGDGVELDAQLDPALGHVRADDTHLDQILMNLVVNARDATPDGGTVTITTGNEVVPRGPLDQADGTSYPATFVVLSVTDTGIGMDAATITQAFEPFFTTKEVGKGTGLGLSTIYGIVKQSNGFVTVDSEPGQGATFKVHLPLVDAPLDPPRDGERQDTAGDESSETILLVEDDEALLSLFRSTLESQGYSVLTAKNGEEGREVWAEHRGSVNLLISDIVMPGMGGVALARELLAQRPELRILLVSGFSEHGVGDSQLNELGASFMRKPFSLTELTSKTREVLDSVPARA
jgi:CheY-like chemotaxis protein